MFKYVHSHATKAVCEANQSKERLSCALDRRSDVAQSEGAGVGSGGVVGAVPEVFGPTATAVFMHKLFFTPAAASRFRC